jgi:phosphoglycolate phosphatase-like HAD superfamily hydrolase
MSPRPALCVVFDLDQTLIGGAEADWECFLSVCEGVLGATIDRQDDWGSYPVLTDLGLLDGLSRRYRGRGVTDCERERFCVELPDRIDALAVADPAVFSPLPGAIGMLEGLVREARVGIATGNLRRLAARKLGVAGLDRFDLPCVCSEDASDRPGLVRACVDRLGAGEATRVVSVGDGVWDVAAAAALGLPFVGVSADATRAARLRERGADAIVEDFADAGRFRALLWTAAVPRRLPPA